MFYLFLAGWAAYMILLIPATRRAVTGVINRRIARRLATGPVNTLFKHDYNYAMVLSHMVAEGDLHIEDATELAYDRMKQAPAIAEQTDGDYKRGPGI